MKPTIRELCEKSTTGPWKAVSGTVREDKPHGDPVCRMYSPKGAAAGAWELIHETRAYTAELIARCSPDNMLKVYELAENIVNNWDESFVGDQSFVGHQSDAQQILDILDGKEP